MTARRKLTAVEFYQAIFAVRFRSWLGHYPSGTFVGWRRDRGECPIAFFLKQRLGRRTITVGPRDVRISKYAFGLPAWAVAFIKALDNNLMGYDRRVDNTQALLTLDRILK